LAKTQPTRCTHAGPSTSREKSRQFGETVVFQDSGSKLVISSRLAASLAFWPCRSRRLSLVWRIRIPLIQKRRRIRTRDSKYIYVWTMTMWRRLVNPHVSVSTGYGCRIYTRCVAKKNSLPSRTADIAFALFISWKQLKGLVRNASSGLGLPVTYQMGV
jgi:hypothetical protein